MTTDEPPRDILGSAHLRVARPTDRMEEVVAFYSNVLGFTVLGRFRDHEGFDGVMLGHSGAGYHFEFTTQHDHSTVRAPTQENLLVFYLPNRPQWSETIERIESFGVKPVKSYNPYWDKHGKTYEDPDGYRIVIQNAPWPSA